MNRAELLWIAFIGEKDVNAYELFMKFIENWVCAKFLLEVVIPFASKRLLKALIEASVVRLGLAM